MAEDREVNRRTDPSVDDKHVHNCAAALRETPAALGAVKNMAVLYRKQKKFDAASLLDDVVVRANKEVSGRGPAFRRGRDRLPTVSSTFPVGSRGRGGQIESLAGH